jgi:hypothetical protein
VAHGCYTSAGSTPNLSLFGLGLGFVKAFWAGDFWDEDCLDGICFFCIINLFKSSCKDTTHLKQYFSKHWQNSYIKAY